MSEAALTGVTVVVTRTRAQASRLVDRLRAHGADPVEVPTIVTEPPTDGGAALRAALDQLDAYEWVVITSPNGAAAVLGAVSRPEQLDAVKIAAIGPSTAAALAAGQVDVDLVPDRYVAEGLVDVFPEPGTGAGRVLLANAEVARDVVPEGLARLGWVVDVVPSYRTVAPPPDPASLAVLDGADVITFTSSSTVTNFVTAFGVEACPQVVACIGPITAATAREAGILVTIESAEHTIDGLVAALVEHFRTA